MSTTTTTMMSTTTATVKNQEEEEQGNHRPQVELRSRYRSRRRRRRRPRILLGVTGSVAAVKAPELAIRLHMMEFLHDDDDAANQDDGRPDIRILLTKGGENFWNKARTYDSYYWTLLNKKLLQSQHQHQQSNTATIGAVEPKDDSKTKSGQNDDDDHENDDVDGTGPPPPPTIELYRSDDEWKGWNNIGDDVLHIQLRNWADVLVVAPLSAHTLSKFANGLCDDTLSCVVRAWDFGQRQGNCGQELYDNDDDNEDGVGDLEPVTSNSSRQLQLQQAQAQEQQQQQDGKKNGGKPVLLAPAMNTYMWQHPITQHQLHTVSDFALPSCNDSGRRTPSASTCASGSCCERHEEGRRTGRGGVHIIAPQVKTLACGEVGNGALASVDTIIQAVADVLSQQL